MQIKFKKKTSKVFRFRYTHYYCHQQFQCLFSASKYTIWLFNYFIMVIEYMNVIWINFHFIYENSCTCLNGKCIVLLANICWIIWFNMREWFYSTKYARLFEQKLDYGVNMKSGQTVMDIKFNVKIGIIVSFKAFYNLPILIYVCIFR